LCVFATTRNSFAVSKGMKFPSGVTAALQRRRFDGDCQVRIVSGLHRRFRFSLLLGRKLYHVRCESFGAHTGTFEQNNNLGPSRQAARRSHNFEGLQQLAPRINQPLPRSITLTTSSAKNGGFPNMYIAENMVMRRLRGDGPRAL
jgi:hypothetical protein